MGLFSVRLAVSRARCYRIQRMHTWKYVTVLEDLRRGTDLTIGHMNPSPNHAFTLKPGKQRLSMPFTGEEFVLE